MDSPNLISEALLNGEGFCAIFEILEKRGYSTNCQKGMLPVSVHEALQEELNNTNIFNKIKESFISHIIKTATQCNISKNDLMDVIEDKDDLRAFIWQYYVSQDVANTYSSFGNKSKLTDTENYNTGNTRIMNHISLNLI